MLDACEQIEHLRCAGGGGQQVDRPPAVERKRWQAHPGLAPASAAENSRSHYGDASTALQFLQRLRMALRPQHDGERKQAAEGDAAEDLKHLQRERVHARALELASPLVDFWTTGLWTAPRQKPLKGADIPQGNFLTAIQKPLKGATMHPGDSLTAPPEGLDDLGEQRHVQPL